MTVVANMFHHWSAVFAHVWLAWMKALLVLLLFWLGGFSFRRVLFYYLSRWAEKTSTQADDIIINASRIHVLFWFFLLGIYAAGHVAPLDAGQKKLLATVVASLFLVSVTFLAAKIAAGFMSTYGKRMSFSLPLTSLTENLVKLVIVVIGILILLSNLGISIAPILTALGVGSLAVALALQDTLSNLFAGFYILANQQIRPGDYIRIESGHEGYVIDIGWRSTRLKELSNNIILIPNAKLGTAIVTNLNLPEKEVSISIGVGIAYDSDLEQVEKVTVEVARETLKSVAGGVQGFEPFIRYNAFADSAIQFNVIFRVREFTDKYLIQHEFIKRLHRRYAEEKIDIPFPQRVVTLRQAPPATR